MDNSSPKPWDDLCVSANTLDNGSVFESAAHIKANNIQFANLDPKQKNKFLEQFSSKKYMAITIGYDTGIIVSYEKSKAILDALQDARVFRPNYSTNFNNVSAKPVKSDTFKTQMVHPEELGQMMLNYILEIGEE